MVVNTVNIRIIKVPMLTGSAVHIFTKITGDLEMAFEFVKVAGLKYS